MAERVVSWKILADFAAAERSAKRAEREIQKLKKATAELNAAQSGGTDTSGASNKNATAAKQVAAAADQSTASIARNVAAQQKQVASARAMEAALKSGAVAAKNAAGAQSSLSSESERLARTARSAVTEQARHSREMDKTATGSGRARDALGRFVRSVRDAGRAAGDSGNGIGNLNRNLNDSAGGWGRSARGAQGFGRSLRLLLIPVIASAIQELSGALGPLAAGFTGLVGAIGPAAGLLATLPGLLTAAVGGIGTLMAGFAGIGGALKAYGQQQKASAKTERSAAKTSVSNAKAVKNAQNSVADARRAAADSARSSSRAIESAERSLSDAHRNARDAQKAVTQARKDAKQQVEDLKKSLKSLELQEESANLSLEEAQRRLQTVRNDPGSTDLERRQAELAVREAKASLQDIQETRKKSTKELISTQRKGIEGSDQVVAARRAEADANRAVADAERNLAESRYNAKRSAQDSARAIKAAQQGVADAQSNAADSAKGAAAATDVFAAAMKKLSPESRAVVMQLLRMKPLMDQIRQAAQRGLMPGVLSFLKDSVSLFPALLIFVTKTARSFGEFATRVGNALSSLGGMRKFNAILNQSYRLIRIFLSGTYDTASALVNLMIAASGLTEWLVKQTRGWAATWKAMTSGEANQRRLVEFFEHTREVAGQLGRIILNLVGAFVNLGKGTQGVGKWMLDAFEAMTRRWRDFTRSVEGQRFLIDWANRAKPVLSEVAALFGALVDGIQALGRRAELANLLAQIRTGLLPALLQVISTLSGGFMSALVSFATNLAEIFTALGNTGILSIFSAALVGISKGLAEISHNAGAVAVLTGLIAVAGSFGVLLGLAKAILFIGSAGQLMVGALNRVRTGFKLTEISARQMWASLGPIGIAIGVVSAAMAFFISKNRESKQRVDDLTQSLRENNGVLDESVRKERIATLSKEGFYDAAKDLGISIETATRAYFGEAKALEEVRRKTEEAIQAEKDGTGTSIRRESAAEQLNNSLARGAKEYDEASQKARALMEADKASLSPTERAARARAENAEATRDESAAKQRLVTFIDAARRAQQAETDAVNAHRNALIQLRGGQRAVNAATRAVSAAIKENGEVFDKNGNALKGMGEKADQSQEYLDQLASSSIDLANSMRESGKSEDDVAAKLKANRENWIKSAIAMGIGETQARKLAKQLFALPARVETDVEIRKREAEEALKAYKTSIRGLPKSVRLALKAYDETPEGLEKARKAIEKWKALNPEMQRVLIDAGVELDLNASSAADLRKQAQDLINGKQASASRLRRAKQGGNRTGYAEGGEVHGPGTETSDSIPVMLSNREFVQNAKATSYYGPEFMHALNQRKISKSSLPGFARGGYVRRSNHLAGGGQPSGGSYSVKLTAGIDTSKLAGSVERAIKIFEPLVRYARSVGANVSSMGKAISASVPRINAFGVAFKAVFSRFNSYLNAPVTAAWKALQAKLAQIQAGTIMALGRVLNYIQTKWTNKVTGYLVNPFKPVPGQVSAILLSLRDRVDSWVSKIGNAWERLGKLAGKPITFIIDTVINRGLIGAYNSVAKNLGVKSISHVGKPAGLATGGVVPAYATGGRIHGGPGRGHGTSDSVLGVDSKGIPTARVSAGEYIVPEKQTKRYFPMLERMRKGLDPYAGGGAVHGPTRRRKDELGGDGAYLPRFAGGGLLGRLASHLPGFFLGGIKPHPGSPSRHSGYGWARWAGDFGSGSGNTPPVRAWGPGRVTSTRTMAGSYGKHMRIDHGSSETLYAHLSQFLARAGAQVKGGQTIARAGWTGNVRPAGPAGAHLHFELKGSGKGGGGGGSSSPGGGSVTVPKVINYLKQFRDKAAGALDDLKSQSLKFPMGELAAAAGKKVYNLMDAKVDKANAKQMSAARRAAAAARRAMASLEESPDSTKPSGPGMSGARSAALRMGASSVNQHTDPQGQRAYDMMSSGATNTRIASHMKANHSKYGIAYVISQMRIASSRAGWSWRPYSPITNQGDFRHVNHVHTSFYAKGTNSAKRGPAVVGENGPELVYMNGGERVVRNEATNLPRYHKGGPVGNFKPGTKSDWVKPLQYAMKQKQTGTWNAALTAALQKNDGKLAVPALPKKPSKSWKSNWSKWVKTLELKLGLGRDGRWGSEITAPLKHMLAHAFKWPVGDHGHKTYDDHPWLAYTDTEKSVREQVRTNKLNSEWDSLLSLFTTWGDDYVVRKLTEVGTAEGMTLARSLSKDQQGAKDYNDLLRVQYDREDAQSNSDSKAAQLQLIIKAVGAGTAEVPVGLQGAAKAVNLSMDSTAGLYDTLRTMPAWTAIPANKRDRFEKDVLDFGNLFKFATGGRVPGEGNGDRVHVLAEPGEFILRRSAVAALTKKFGAGALGQLNHADKFATGGFVPGGLGMPSFAPSSVSLTSQSSKTSETSRSGNTYNFNTVVNNPTLEDGALSVQKRVTRTARSGILK